MSPADGRRFAAFSYAINQSSPISPAHPPPPTMCSLMRHDHVRSDPQKPAANCCIGAAPHSCGLHSGGQGEFKLNGCKTVIARKESSHPMFQFNSNRHTRVERLGGECLNRRRNCQLCRRLDWDGTESECEHFAEYSAVLAL